MRGHNLLHKVETQPGAFWLRRIQGLENRGELLGRDATPGIPHVQLGVCARALACQDECPPLRHGVQGILHEVAQGATERVRMQSDGAQRL